MNVSKNAVRYLVVASPRCNVSPTPPDVRHGAHRGRAEERAVRAGQVARVDAPERGVRQHVVEAEVEVRPEEHGDGDLCVFVCIERCVL